MPKILLVEHDDGAARTLADSLRRHGGWDVTLARSVLEAIREAGDHSFDAAILDAKLPDGNGADILDFLRIGSPGIRILLLSEARSESVALHALSHGAGDVLVKDKHLARELPRRIDELLRTAPEIALVETLRAGSYDTGPHHPEPDRDALEPATRVETALDRLLGGPILAAAVFADRGRPVAVRLRPGLDADGIGFALATIHGQIGSIFTYGNVRPIGYSMLIDLEGGTLGVAAIPGTYIVAVVFDATLTRGPMMERLDHAAEHLSRAFEA